MSGPSKQHAEAVAEGARHHASSKTYSGSLMRPHVPFLENLIRRRLCRSAIDYGCGKGVQYEWRDPKTGNRTIEERFGFAVFKYDPCYPPFAEEPPPSVTFDLVICTHTLALIPEQDLDWVIHRLHRLAGRRGAVFIAEKIGERKKGEVADPGNRAIGWSAQDWLDRIAPIADAYVGIETVFSSRERTTAGTITTRYTRRDNTRRDRGWHAETAGL